MFFLMWLNCHGFPNQMNPMMSFHIVVDLYQVLNPCSARCWDSEVALLTHQEVKVGNLLLKAHGKLEII